MIFLCVYSMYVIMYILFIHICMYVYFHVCMFICMNVYLV